VTPLGEALRRRLVAGGPITVAAFMAEAAAHYYRRDPFGPRGDFVTAPEVSQMFGELIGLWAAEVWRCLGAPAPVLLVELGPGRGTMMADALRAARLVPDFLEAARIHLVETSLALAAAARERLAVHRPTLHAHLAEVPDGPAIVLANEFLDALPVRQFVRAGAGWRERLIAWDEAADALAFTLDPRPSPLAALATAGLEHAPEGTVAEFSPQAAAVAGELGRRIARQEGAALLIDYGDAGPLAGPTLQAVRRHAPADVLAHPGEADLTAHVDFALIARAAREAGAETYGPVPQGAFLGALGIAERARRLKERASPAEAAGIDAALERLVSPSAMGTLFKALALVPRGMPAPPGLGVREAEGRPIRGSPRTG
jgi:NADH dehydrogenase [ubiquinone] 1 alpha subcomplex assembly factor 7